MDKGSAEEMTHPFDSDCPPFSIRLTAARKRALERLAAREGMSAPQYVETMVARLVAEAEYGDGSRIDAGAPPVIEASRKNRPARV
jgi:hypothetical protein